MSTQEMFLMDVLNGYGVAPDFATRFSIANLLMVENYQGYEKQDTELVKKVVAVRNFITGIYPKIEAEMISGEINEPDTYEVYKKQKLELLEAYHINLNDGDAVCFLDGTPNKYDFVPATSVIVIKQGIFYLESNPEASLLTLLQSNAVRGIYHVEDCPAPEQLPGNVFTAGEAMVTILGDNIPNEIQEIAPKIATFLNEYLHSKTVKNESQIPQD